MGASAAEFESLEQQFLELMGEFRTIHSSEARLREAIRTECTRAESAEAARDAAERAAVEARNSAAAATAGATQAATELAAVHEQLASFKLKLELSDRQRKLQEERHADLLAQLNSLEREIQELRPLQTSHVTLQRQYTELHERICTATEDARREASQLECELRRVERCAAGGSEIRDRARLAAAAHAREKRLAAAELQHTSRELGAANAEINKLKALVAEMQFRLSDSKDRILSKALVSDEESVQQLRDALETERAGTEKLEKALAAALADNAVLAAKVHASDNNDSPTKLSLSPPTANNCTNICPIDTFLAD
ncbi:uncharacterized protein LOC110385347 isoform X1 [Bombyx mori]|uniref:Uncharacterized protein n=1 Tax=Bombyx mori TaxID=7091 RepID=A0A8R2DKL4_BOMMO|nr:uncharacterized protein LOC110385347 isoform X1 [Bombyx mori]